MVFLSARREEICMALLVSIIVLLSLILVVGISIFDSGRPKF